MQEMKRDGLASGRASALRVQFFMLATRGISFLPSGNRRLGRSSRHRHRL